MRLQQSCNNLATINTVIKEIEKMKRSKTQLNAIYNYYAKKRMDAITEFMDYNGLWGEFKVSGYKRPTMFLKWVKGIEVYPDGTFEQCDDWIAPRFRKE